MTLPVWRLCVGLSRFLCDSVRSEIVTYPAPAEEKLSQDYEVFVNDQKLDVYTARTLDASLRRQTMGFRRSLFVCQFRHVRAGRSADYVRAVIAADRYSSAAIRVSNSKSKMIMRSSSD